MADAIATFRRNHDNERNATFTVDIQPGGLVVLPGGAIGINNSLDVIKANTVGRYSTEGVVELRVTNTPAAAIAEGAVLKLTVASSIVTDVVNASGTTVGAMRTALPASAGPHVVRFALNAAK